MEDDNAEKCSYSTIKLRTVLLTIFYLSLLTTSLCLVGVYSHTTNSAGFIINVILVGVLVSPVIIYLILIVINFTYSLIIKKIYPDATSIV